ncbi:MAG: YabP/YqfC family sporulation protein [Ruminococcus sp.]
MGKRLIDAGRRAQFETYLQLTGNREIYLENCRRILEYNDIRIVVQTAELVLEIWGE